MGTIGNVKVSLPSVTEPVDLKTFLTQLISGLAALDDEHQPISSMSIQEIMEELGQVWEVIGRNISSSLFGLREPRSRFILAKPRFVAPY